MGALSIAGYASLFGVVDLAGDVVAKGAFARSLADWPIDRVPMLFQHDPARRIGRWHRIEEDSVGLWVEGNLDPGQPGAAQAAAMIRSETMRGLSIGFRTRSSDLRPGGGRVLHEIALREVSLVAFPMLPGARLRLVSSPAPAGTLPDTARPIPQAA
ncbi:MAG: HK97 family phage prohead protease [Hyphomonadaceae bacterium]|jgi:hypothetical protein|nr:HK97 family phage prohead protease [Hyphomonadaceae bacterium]